MKLGDLVWRSALRDKAAGEAVFGGSSGGLTLSFGPSQSYTVVADDATGDDSWYGSGATAKLVLVWTPTVSGSMYLPPIEDDSGDFEIDLWKGGEEGVDFPNPVDDFTTDPAHRFVEAPTPFRITAGQPYALIVVNWAGTLGAVVDLDPIYSALGGWGGVDDPPEPPADMPVVIARLPDDRTVARILPVGDAGEGNDTHAEGVSTEATGLGSHAEGFFTVAGFGSHAEGQHSQAGNGGHAEGQQTQATGLVSHAEGQQTEATGNYSHAEGSVTIASGDSAHAEGAFTRANGNYSHAEGYLSRVMGGEGYEAFGAHVQGLGARAYQPGQDAHAGGQFGTDFPIQVSRFVMGNVSTDDAPATLRLDHGFGDLNNQIALVGGLIVVRGLVAATNVALTKCAVWEFVNFVNGTNGDDFGTPTLTKILDEDSAGWLVFPQTPGASFSIHGVGEIGETVRWVAQVELTEVNCG